MGQLLLKPTAQQVSRWLLRYPVCLIFKQMLEFSTNDFV